MSHSALCVASNADTPEDQIIQVVLHDEATNQPENVNKEARNPAEDNGQPVLTVGDTGKPEEFAEGAKQLLQKRGSVTVPPLSQLHFPPLKHSSSLGSTDMDISDSDESLEDGKMTIFIFKYKLVQVSALLSELLNNTKKCRCTHLGTSIILICVFCVCVCPCVCVCM